MSEKTDLLLTEIRDLLLKIEANTRGLHAKLPPAGAAPASTATAHTGWKAARVPRWAKFDKGIPFGDLSAKSLAYWFKWTPQGFRGAPPSDSDITLRKLLDEAQAQIDAGTYIPPERTVKPAGYDEANPRPPRRETPVDDGPEPMPGGEIRDEDVPF